MYSVLQQLFSSRRQSWIWTSSSALCEGSAALYICAQSGWIPGQTRRWHRQHREVCVCMFTCTDCDYTCMCMNTNESLFYCLASVKASSQFFSSLLFSCKASQKPCWNIGHIISLLCLVEFNTPGCYWTLDTNGNV